MSVIDKVVALRRLLGIDSSLELPPAIVAMNAAMGITGEGTLPAQVNTLIDMTGVQVTAATPAAAAPAAAVGGKKVPSPAPSTPLNKKQKTLFDVMPSAGKTSISASELRKQRELALKKGESYEPEYSDARTSKSERGESSRAAAPVKVHPCSRCPRVWFVYRASDA